MKGAATIGLFYTLKTTTLPHPSIPDAALRLFLYTPSNLPKVA
jgi:hypothetical protein